MACQDLSSRTMPNRESGLELELRTGSPAPTPRLGQDAFIIATGRDNITPDAGARKFIRHHVMKGKNKVKTKKISKLSAQRQSAPYGSWISPEGGSASATTQLAISGAVQSQVSLPSSMVFRLDGSDSPFMGCAVEMGPHTMEMVHSCKRPILSCQKD